MSSSDVVETLPEVSKPTSHWPDLSKRARKTRQAMHAKVARFERSSKVLIVVVLAITSGALATAYINSPLLSGHVSSAGSSNRYGGGLGCNLAPASGFSANMPLSTYGAAVATDTASGSTLSGLTLMFGGASNGAASPSGQTWEYQNGCWAQICGAGTCNPCGYGQSYAMTPDGCGFGYTGSSYATWTVPSTGTYTVDLAGGAGGGTPYWYGGNGGRVQASISLTATHVLDIYVGGAGTTITGTAGGAGGYPGGGAGGSTPAGYYGGGGGGGYSGIYDSTSSTWLAIAGAGGGTGGDSYSCGSEWNGAGGNGSQSGTNGDAGGTGGGCTEEGTGGTSGGGGGTAGANGCTGTTAPTAGGTRTGGNGGGYTTGNCVSGGGGGGGAGYVGGGGGGDGYENGGGGGGGSSYCDTSSPYSCSVSAYTAAYETGNGFVYISNIGISFEPMPRYGASLAWDPSLGTSGAFVLTGGCSEAYNDTAGYFFTDTCNYNDDTFSDTWAFIPGTTFGSGSWSFQPTATCFTLAGTSVGYPATEYVGLYGTAALGATTSSQGCVFTAYDLTGCGGTGNNYCDAIGEFGGSMVYDPDTTQCGLSAGATCLLLYDGGGNLWSDYSTTTYAGPCMYEPSGGRHGGSSKYACGDELWELSGSLGSMTWTLEDYETTCGDGDSACTGASSNYGSTAGTYTAYDSATSGRAWGTLVTEGCTSGGCTIVLVGGIELSNAGSAETTSINTYYLTSTVTTPFTAITTASDLTSEQGWCVYYSSGSDATLSGMILFSGGISSTGTTTGVTAQSGYIWYLNPASLSSGWTKDSALNNPGPDSLTSPAAFWDPVTTYVLVFGGWDNDVGGGPAGVTATSPEGGGGEYVLT